MRVLGHPVHVMLVHFPVALWPAHWLFHCLAQWLPTGVAGAAGFWLLASGTALGWVAACFGVADLLSLTRRGGEPLTSALIHGSINGSVLLAFTLIVALEWPHYPEIAHGTRALVLEGALLAVLGVGNYFGGAVIWNRMPAET